MGAMGRSRPPTSKAVPDSVAGWLSHPCPYFVDTGARSQGAPGAEDGK